MDEVGSLIVLSASVAAAIAIAAVIQRSRKQSRQPAETPPPAYNNKIMWGENNPALVCPHCQEKGYVRTTHVRRKKGVSGAKATGALLTGGVSLFVTGLSRKEGCTQAHCCNCNSTWDY